VENGSVSSSSLPKLAYELSLKALERQERVLDELRARTGTMLAASALAASFLGARASDEGSRILAVLAVAAFAGSIGAGIYVLLPKPGLIFSLRGSVLFESEFEDATKIGETHRRLAYWLEGYYDDNEEVIQSLFRWFRWATIGVLAQVVLWIVEIIA
jgi:hypothetical protein